MNRSKPMRRTEMKRGRFTPSSKAKAKARQFEADLNAVTPALVERAGGKCEARIVGACATGLPTAHRHHKRHRNDPQCANTLECLLYLCSGCHHWIHDHPMEANKLGLLLKATDTGDGYVPLSAGVTEQGGTP